MEQIIEQKTFLGYSNNDTQIATSAYSLVDGSKNVLIVGNDPSNYSVETRNGYIPFGTDTPYNQSITGSYDTFANGSGKVIPIRYGSVGMEVYYNGIWTRINSLPLPHEPYFTEWWDDVKKMNTLIYVGGNDSIYSWKGQIAQVTGLSTNTISVDVDPLVIGFQNSGLLSTDSGTYSYTSISGNTFQGVTPDPVAGGLLLNNIVHVGISSLNGGYVGCNKINNKFDITATFKNHVFYGDYSSKELFISSSFYSYDETPDIVNTNMSFNDISVTGTPILICSDLPSGSASYKKIKIEIDGVAQQTIVNSSGLNAVSWNYQDHNSSVRDTYRVHIISALPIPTFEAFHNGNLIFPSQPVVPSFEFVMPNGVKFTFNTNNPLAFSDDTASELLIGPNDTYKWSEDTGSGYTVIGSNTDVSIPLSIDGITYQYSVKKGHKLGEFIEYIVYSRFVGIEPFTNFYESKPRRITGEGAVRILDSAPVAFIVQENAMYINGQGGEWYEVIYVLSDDGTYEKIEIKRLKSARVNKILRMANMTHTKNDIVFVTTDKSIDSIGRVLSVDVLPQNSPMSDPIKKDIKSSLWFANENGELNGHCIHYDNKTFFIDPSTQTLFIYDHLKGFWQPPQKGIPISRLAIIEGKLCGHSSIGEGTYQLFTGTNDNGSIIQASVRLAYNNYGSYSEKKNVQRLFTAGFKNDRSNLTAEILFGYNGCEGRVEERVDPIMCISRDDVSIGKSSLSKHGHANLLQEKYDWFEHMIHFPPHSDFYNVSIGYYDNSMDGYFRIVCTGMDATNKNAINSQKISKKANTQEPPDIVGIPNNFGKSNYINQPDYVDTVFFGEVQSGSPWTGPSDGTPLP